MSDKGLFGENEVTILGQKVTFFLKALVRWIPSRSDERLIKGIQAAGTFTGRPKMIVETTHARLCRYGEYEAVFLTRVKKSGHLLSSQIVEAYLVSPRINRSGSGFERRAILR